MKLLSLIFSVFYFQTITAQDFTKDIEVDTSFQMENIQLNLKSIDCENFNVYFLNDEKIDSLSRDIFNSFLIAQEIENYQLKKFGDLVERESEYLSFKLKTGAIKILSPDSISEEEAYSFEYFFENVGFYSLVVHWTEGQEYKLINYETGIETNIVGRPFFSNSGKYLIALGNDIEANYSFNGLGIYKNEEGIIRKIGTFSPRSYGFSKAKWLDDQHVIIQNESLNYLDQEFSYFNFYTILELKP